MSRRTGFILAALLITQAPAAFAQRAEVSFNVGYSASEGITSDERPLLGQLYDTLAVDSGTSINLTFAYLFNERMAGEFLYGRQNSRFQADGPGGKLPFAELVLHNYLFNLVYNLGARDAALRPYVFGGLGATSYSFGELLIATPGGVGGEIEGETRFSTNWGAGIKYYFSPSIGAKFGFRWTPTFIRSDPEGIWCDPFYGCWELVDTEYANQFETAVGVTFRFD